ncbi:1-acyl-sn-glycerol-3-phosphate acyltransferase [Streptohalobacillus salinus]|uniref:1-acyl-sn-glycerol-3-phosphate acyltransferase n=1 Tax=Streptohalobacillus salinus TaxID=621096 RepID=A0A2V3WB77_9BACI|nr:lysophospholipid acyltransferase family protein [Streptohalobacillus salinus]PXW91717.1 1-acyl-sn-glycerol-3-phosphate acyltransferase [Streptohalobacillus salinus]
MSFQKFVKTVVWYGLKPFFRMKVEGREYIPKEGSAIICANHISNWDPPVFGSSIKREVHFIAKEELFHKKWLAALMTSLKVFPIKRGMSDRQALRKALGLLKNGEALGLFPEGTRSKTGDLQKGMSGVGFFALRSDAVVVPCAIIGPYKIGRQMKLVYGPPVDMTELRERKADPKEVTERIMAAISELIENNR